MEDNFSKIITISLLLLTIIPSCKSGITTRLDQNYNKYLLPKHVIPIHYYIKLTPNMHNDVYMGYVKILVEVVKSANNITMHQTGLVISPEKVYLVGKTGSNKNKEIRNDGISELSVEEFYIIHFKNKLAVGTYELFITQYFGIYDKNANKGLYYRTYFDDDNSKRKFVISFFEPTYARQAFPCFDEPDLKATFKIIIIRPKDYHSASNSILIKSTYLYNSLVEDEFEETVKLPTYTIAFMVSNLTLSQKVTGDIHQVIARQKCLKNKQERYSLDLAKRSYKDLETFLKKKIPLNKLYHVVLPSNRLHLAAMENWGLITYTENYFMMAKNSSIFDIERLADSVVHELVHQWFGNLVTPKWWDYIWLSEGFATYLSYEIINNLNPEWNIIQNYQIEVLSIMEEDSKNNTISLNHKCDAPLEINSNKFISLSYVKGAAIVRMMGAILSREVFRRGLKQFLNDWQFDSVTPKDLYKSLDKVVRETNIKLIGSMSRTMETWDSQIGYPVVGVERDYGFDTFIVELTQKRFMLHDNLEPKPIWNIPVNFATKNNPNFYNLQASYWLNKKRNTFKVKDLMKNDWLIINKKAAYYYRVNYDSRNWDLLATALKENFKQIDVHNRAQLIDDAFSLASMGEIPYKIPLKISEYFHLETEYAPLSVIKRAFDILSIRLSGSTETAKYLTNYFTRNVVKIYDIIEKRQKFQAGHANKKIVILIFSWLCNLQHTLCISKVESMFHEFRMGQELPVDLEEQVLCTAMKRGKQNQWLNLFNHTKFNNQREYTRFFTLACSNNTMLLQRFLRYTLTALTKSDLLQAMQVAIRQGPIGCRVSLKFIAERFSTLLHKLERDDLNSILTTLGSRITKKVDLQTLQDIRNEHLQHKALFKQGLLGAYENIQWNDDHLQEIHDYLKIHAQSGTTACNTMGINSFVAVMVYLVVGMLPYY